MALRSVWSGDIHFGENSLTEDFIESVYWTHNSYPLLDEFKIDAHQIKVLNITNDGVEVQVDNLGKLKIEEYTPAWEV